MLLNILTHFLRQTKARFDPLPGWDCGIWYVFSVTGVNTCACFFFSHHRAWLTSPRVRWIPETPQVNLFSGDRPSIRDFTFFATTAACAAPGLPAFCTPVSAISPTPKRLGYLSSRNCMVGLTRIKPLSGLIRDPVSDGHRSWTRLLFGVWPVARMTKSDLSFVPLVSSTSTFSTSLVNPSGGITTREPVMSLLFS